MAGIYVHVPFCKQKCTYCDFASYPKEINKIDAYFACLYREIKGRALLCKDIVFDTIYFGGGTPSIAPAKYIRGALNQIKKCFKLSDNPEITIEINPGTIDEEKVAEYKKAGINRFSIGLQTGFNDQLKRLNRIHTALDFLNCTKLLQGENLSADVLIGLHEQTYDHVKRANLRAIALGKYYLPYEWVGAKTYVGTKYTDCHNQEAFDLCKHKQIDKFALLKDFTSTADSIVSEFDKDGKKAYMAINYTEPTYNIDNTLEFAFDGAKTATVIIEGEPSEVALEGGKLTVNLKAGEGVFVIPE